MHEGRLAPDGLGVDEIAAVVLALEKAEVVAVGVGGVVDEDDLNFPFDILFAHFTINYISNGSK